MEETESEWSFPRYTGGEKKKEKIHTRLEEEEEEEREETAVYPVVAAAVDFDFDFKDEEGNEIWAYEEHYAACHLHQCRSCGKAFSSARLLSIHLVERHDSFFLARAARGERVYECLADACEEKFCSKRARRRHLVREHAYPRDFYLPGIEEKQRETKKEGAAAQTTTPTAGAAAGKRLQHQNQKIENREEAEAEADDGMDIDVDQLSGRFAKQLAVPSVLGYGAMKTSTHGRKPRARLQL